MANKKTLDRTFLHYGVKQEDMELIEQACQTDDIDAEWFKEYILKAYNDERNNQNFVEERKRTRILKTALKNLPK